MQRPHLHLVADMGFADCFADHIDALGLQEKNHIMLVGKRPDKRLTKRNLPYTNLTDTLSPDPANYDRVYAHFLLPMVCHWLQKHPGLRINWVFYGADVYRNPLVKYDPIGPETKPYLSFNLNDFTRTMGYWLVHRRAWQKALHRVDSLLWSNPIEFQLVQSLIPSCKATFEPFWYGKSLADFKIPRATLTERNSPVLNVQLGHCAFPSVNHMDFLKATGETSDIQYHVPISYGDARYGEWLEKQTHSRGDLTWLKVRLPIKEYMLHIDQMDAAIFPNVRQQGLANIRSFLLQGKPVFLHPDNPSYVQLKEQGVEVGDCQNFSRSEYERLLNVGNTNAALIQKHFSEEACAANYLRLFS